MAHRTFTQWQDIVSQQEASGLNVAAYCQQSNINPKTFYNRRAKLGLLETVKAPADSKPAQIAVVSTGFIQVKPATVSTPSASAMTLTTSQATLPLPSTVSPQWLGQLLRELAA
jgi:hypothetical protein